jgi:putative addiction module component (TIGR02574 family)
MTGEAKKVLDDALRLPDAERAELVGLLIESLDDESDANVQEAWSEEIAKRLAEIDNGSAKTIPWSEVRRRMTQAKR